MHQTSLIPSPTASRMAMAVPGRLPLRVGFLLIVILCQAPTADRPAAVYEEWRHSPAPVSDTTVAINPPPLQWPSVRHWEGRSVVYQVELSDDPTFPTARTMRSGEQPWCFYNHHQALKPGTWHWRYLIKDQGTVVTKGPYSFVVASSTPVFETPSFQRFLTVLPKERPCIVTQGQALAAVRARAAGHPLARRVIDKGLAALAQPPYTGPVTDPDLAQARRNERKASASVRGFRDMVEAYALSDRKDLLARLVEQAGILSRWPTDDLLGSQVLTALALAYDTLQGDLPADTRQRILTVITNQLGKGLARWPGLIEGRQVENHFWQMEIAGNFIAGLATARELESGRRMLEYTYELFIARFPNLAALDGGWAEGFGYLGVNQSAYLDMALLLKKVGGVDVLASSWYHALPDYLTYFSPVDGPIDGFGDGHDRVRNGNGNGDIMFILAQENHDMRAAWRAASTPGFDWEACEPLYQIIHGAPVRKDAARPPTDLPQARLFNGVGLAAFHTDVLHAAQDTAVYFRSSPFGAKGHMHANQNAFNIARHGEHIFYSSGYYTTFSDPHSLSSYRHTRAHNAILVNGCGQAFGHEGYGWIKRFADGDWASYACGDATMAYRPTVDGQFLDMLKESGIPHTPAGGFGDGQLNLFERHIMLLRPDTVVVYDILDARTPSDWSLLLHSPKRPVMDEKGQLRLDTGTSQAVVLVAGSQPVRQALTDAFHTKPVDIKQKYGPMPDQFHMRYDAADHSPSMRFLTIISMADAGRAVPPIVASESGIYTVGDVRITAGLSTDQAPFLIAEGPGGSIHIDRRPDGQATSPVATTWLVDHRGGDVRTVVADDRPVPMPDH